MSAEQRFFVQLLRDYVHSAPTADTTDELDWELLARYAKAQDLCGIVYFQCRDLVSVDKRTLEELHAGFLSDVYRAVNGSMAMEEIAASLDAADVDYLPFKGEVFQRYYPHPELRTMGDRDILIHHTDRKLSDRVMSKLGYTRFIDNHAVWTYQRPALMFEIHDHMFYEHLTNRIDYQSYFDSVWESAVPADAHRFLPEPELHFLFLMVHTAKHIINHGIGFRAFLDMVFFCRNESSLDWNSLAVRLKQLGLYEFTLRCFSLCEAWFQIAMPLPCGTADAAFLSDSTEKIFRDGIFGLDNPDNDKAFFAKEIMHDGKPYAVAAIMQTLRGIFPPYRDLQLVPWYSWIDGKPGLLPAAWIYRWLYVVFHKINVGGKKLCGPFQKEPIKDRQLLLERWGL